MGRQVPTDSGAGVVARGCGYARGIACLSICSTFFVKIARIGQGRGKMAFVAGAGHLIFKPCRNIVGPSRLRIVKPCTEAKL